MRSSRWLQKGMAFLLSLALVVPTASGVGMPMEARAAKADSQATGDDIQEEANAQEEAASRNVAGVAREGAALQGENIAIKATAGADYSNKGTDAKWVNDGYLAKGANTTWNTWKEAGDLQYPTPIWLEWEEECTLSGMRVIWWADNANISGSDSVTFPKSCQVQYLNEAGEWATITGMLNESKETVDSVGVLFNPSDGNGLNGSNQQWNTVVFPEPVKTKKLRLLVERSGTGKNGIGISEWEVYGEGGSQSGSSIADGVNIARAATPTAEYSKYRNIPGKCERWKHGRQCLYQLEYLEERRRPDLSISHYTDLGRAL